MTTLESRPVQNSYDELAHQFRPVFDRITETTVARERDRTLPYEPVRWLKDAGFGALRVPIALGGFGATLEDLFGLLIELGAADSNLPQILRAHFGFIEGRLADPESEVSRRWLTAASEGAIFGNAVTEIGEAAVGQFTTKLARNDDHWELTGTKFYSTGSLYADWVAVLAQNLDTDAVQFVVIPSDSAGIELVDDWDGFGQRATGSGTTVLNKVMVQDDWVLPNEVDGPTHLISFYQLVQLAALAGIGAAIARDGAEFVRHRDRIYSLAKAMKPSDDDLVLQVVGELSAAAFGARSTVLAAVEDLAAASVSTLGTDTDAALLNRTEISTYQAQYVVGDLVLRSATRLFDVGGASALRSDRQLDRHWRNARTLFSHNPIIYKTRIVGDWEVNQTPPPFNWLVGTAPK